MNNLGQVIWDIRTESPVIFLGYGIDCQPYGPDGMYILKDTGELEHIPTTKEYGSATRFFQQIRESDDKRIFTGEFCVDTGLCGRGNHGVLQLDADGVAEEMIACLVKTFQQGITKFGDGHYKIME